MQRGQAQTSGVAVLDELVDGVRVGDNLVVVFDAGLPTEWLVERFIIAAGHAHVEATCSRSSTPSRR